MSVKVEIPNLPGVTRSIARIPGALGDRLRSASAQARRLLVSALSAYPPPPPGSRYVRTYRLRRGWERATPIAGGKGFQLINPVEYAGFVQGEPSQQSKAHRGRWRSASAIAHELEEEVLQLFEDATEEAIP